METEIKRTSTKDIIAYLAEKFPGCFSIKGPVKPLKIGIFQDLAEKLTETEDEVVSKTRLRQALRHYTSSWRYLKSVKKGVFRVDIDGKDVDEIDQDQANYASQTLKVSQEKFGNTKKNEKEDNKTKEVRKVANKKNSSKTSKDSVKSAKYKSVKSSKRSSESKKPALLKPVESATIKIGSEVKVQLGNTPMSAVITDISGNDISVQLDSGMMIKTKMQNIYS